MPITIWEPARYAEGFAKDSSGIPINGANADSPFDRDTKVREIARYDGWKQVYYCDTGEFEISTTDARPDDVKRGYMLDVDGDMFVIEDYEWSLEGGQYTVTMSGRDFWKFPESEVSRRQVGVSYAMGELTGDYVANQMAVYFHYTDMKAGWFRDMRRYPWAEETFTDFYENIVSVAMPDDEKAEFLAKSVGNQIIKEIMPYASEWRLFASWFGVGIRFRFAFNQQAGVYEIHPEIYSGDDNGILIRSTDRGVSGFKYRYSTRSEVNAVFAGWESSRFGYTPDYLRYVGDDFNGNTTDYGEDTDRGNIANILDAVSGNDGATNYAERVAMFGEKYLNAGTTPQESDGTGAGMVSWLKGTIEDTYTRPETAFEFDYDNTGAYRYGEHFALGDYITVQDAYLGVSSKQRLTGVKTTYAKDGKKYGFEFSNQRISQSETLRRKFAEIDRRTNVNGRRM